MFDTEREKIIRNEAEFRGYTHRKLEDLCERFDEMKKDFENHLEKEMKMLEIFSERLKELENWKIKVGTISSMIGGLVGFFVSYFIK